MSPAVVFALDVAVVLVLGVVTTLAGSPLVRVILRIADSPRSSKGEPDGAGADEPSPGIQAASAQLQGGHWIGLLERLAIYVSILAGFGEGIAIVLAIKGLARYPDLKATTTGAAERFIIGTFTSVLFAAACAGLARWLLGLW